MQKHYNVDDVYDVAVGLEQALDGLQDNDRIKRLTVQASALIQMFASVLCVRTIPPTSERQIDGVMQSIGQRLGIDYAAEKERYLSQCQSAPKATQAKAQAATLDLALPPFSEMVRPWVIKELRDEYEAQANEAAAEVERLEKPPASWTGTKKAYLEQPSTKNALDRSREQRDEYRKIATRLRNGSIDEAEYPSVVTQINTSIRKAEREQNGVLTKPQRDARVISLLLSIFADEDAGADLDFYPTPDDIIARYMFDDNAELISEIPPDATILEPSAGRGNIADEISKRFPKAAIDVVELSDIRREVLYHKGYNIVGTDFMQVGVASRDDRGRITLTDEYKGKYDAVFMNPPFLKGQGREHVKRALDMVAIDGVLVAVMPTSWIDGTGQDNVFFQDHVKQRADVTFKIVKESEYNANHSRKITIDIAIATMVKRREVEQIDEDEARASHDAASREIVEKWSRDRVQLPTAQGEVDKEFIPPKIITARPEITSKASEDFIPTTLRKKYDFVKDHVYEGANKAIEGLNRTGGFLLADGTGTGKTIQALLVARHYWATTGQPVMIFTVDDRVIQGSFFADARKLGWDTPDLIDTATSERPNRPRNYSGLYDDATPTVSLYKRDRGVQDGINVTTYNTLSNWKGLESVKAGYDAAKTEHENMVEEYENKVAAFIKTLDIKYPKRNNKRTKEKGELGYKKELEAYKEAIQNQINDDPRTRELYVAKELLLDSIKADMRNFMSTAQLVIFDESHKIKNAGDGLDFEAMSIRAQLALGIIDQVPRVLYMTATPADRPFDVLYLKKLGFWRDNKEFRRGMYAIGYKWQEPLYNSRGEQVASGRWSKTSTQTALDVSRSNGEMRRLFQLATEDGNMIRREIQLTNLTVKIHKFPAPKSALDMMETVREEYTEENEKGQVKVDYNAMTMVQMQELERYKIDKALELIDQAVTSGKQVVTFCYTVEEQEVQRKKKKATKAGTVEVLKNILSQRYGEDKVGVLVGTDNDYEDFRRLENVQNFQSGKVRVLIGTITSGGTGVNLDDVTGRNPREMVVITPPLSFINVMQGVGRIVRANTKSRSTAHFIFTDNTPVDGWLSRLLATKFETLNATVEGETNRLSLSQSEETEDTGSQGVISLIASNEGKDKVVVRKHPRRVKGNFRHNGWEMTNNTPYYVTVEGTPKNSTLIIGGRTRADLDTLKKQYGDLIERLQLKPNINRNFQKYNGPHYGRWFGNRDETYDSVLDELLNIVDPRLESAFTSQQEFKVGDEALVAEAIDWAGLPTGTLVRVVAVRARMTDQESWRYDVEHEDKLYKSILGHQLKSVAQEQTVEIDPVGTVLEYNGEAYKTYQENRWSRPTSYSSVVKRIATIKSFDGATVTIDVRAWVIDGRTKENDDETLTEVTFDVLDYEKRRKIAFEEISYDGKTGKETYWQRRYDLVSVTPPNKQTPEYKMVADDDSDAPHNRIARRYDEASDIAWTWSEHLSLDYYLRASRQNLMQTSRTAKGVVDVSASKEKAEKIVAGLTSEQAASRSVDNYDRAIRYLWTRRKEKFTTPAQITDLCDTVNKIVTQGVTKEGTLLRTDDSPKYPYLLAKDIDKARKAFAKQFLAALQETAHLQPGSTVGLAAWIEWRVNLIDHVYADGVGKTSKALATFVMMRGHMPLPTYGDNKEFFSYAPKKHIDVYNLPSYDSWIAKGWSNLSKEENAFIEYYHGLLPWKPTQQMSDRLCNLQSSISEIDSLYRQWAKKVATDDSKKAALIRIESEINRLKYVVGGVGGASGCESCPPREANGELCITESCLNQLESVCEQAAQTWSEEAGTMTRKPWDFWQAAGYAYPRNPWYTQKTGFPATVERFKLHKRIIDDLRDKTTCAESLTERPIAVLTGGAPGSGKSSFIREEAPWLLDPEKFMHIDADAMREKLPEYAGWNATLTHEEASVLYKIALKEIAHPCKRNVLYDGTMNNIKKYNELIDTLEELGYDIYIIYMEIPEAISKQRVLKRYQSSGRYVPRYVIEDFYKTVNRDNAFEKLKNRVSGWVQVNGLNREVMARGGEAIPTVGAQNGKRIKQDKTPESFAPPQSVQDAAKKGLELRRKHNRGGTEVGVARARDLSNGRNVSFDTIKRMHSYFQRHEVDKRGKDWGNKQSPSAGYIAWQLWGGDAGRKWAAEILGQQEKKSP